MNLELALSIGGGIVLGVVGLIFLWLLVVIAANVITGVIAIVQAWRYDRFERREIRGRAVEVKRDDPVGG